MSVSRCIVPLLVATSVAGGCQRQSAEPADAPTLALDESQLIQPIRFTPSDLDPAQNACTDFTAHTNGTWLAANPIPADQTSWGAFNILHERSLQVQKQIAEHVAGLQNPTGIEKIVGDLWTTGMDAARLNEQGVAPLASRLAAIDALMDSAAVAAHIRDVAKRGENPLFAFGPEADFKDSAVNIAYAMQGGTNLPDRSYYFDADKQAIRDAYVAHIAKVLELSGVPADAAATQARDVMAFETRLAKASKSAEELSRDVSLYYNPVTLEEADALTPNFPWTTFFASQEVAPQPKFSLAVPNFHQEVSRMLTEVPVDQWKAYLRYQVVDNAAPYLSDDFATEHFEFYERTLRGQQEQRPRWKRVLRAVESGAGEAMGQLYVKVAFPPESRARMETLVSNLTAALKARIEKLTWMSDETKTKALAKWERFTPKIGYPSKWRDWSGLSTSRESYFENVVAAQSFNYRRELAKIGKPVDKTEWGMTPQTVNAYYNPLANEIVFPAAILQPPFFDPAADDAYNYGGIGAVIGHELTHGYDDQGARFGPDGNFEQWWSKEDAEKFSALTRALVTQFNAYEVEPGLKVNGSLTLGENIADLGGLAVAYDALQRAAGDAADTPVDGLTRDQRCFYGWASVWRAQVRPEALKVQLASDPHAPASVRAFAAPANHPAFAKAFSCAPTDRMANVDRVVIW